MNIEEIRDYCLAKSADTESLPFNDTALVYKVAERCLPCWISQIIAGASP